MNKYLKAALAASALLAILVSVSACKTKAPADLVITARSPAPDFTAGDVVTGKQVTLSSYAGKMVILNFENYGCSQATNDQVSSQLLIIQQIYKQRSDVMPVSVFCGCCPPDVLRKFATDNGLDWPWILDTGGSIVAKYSSFNGSITYPTLFLIDKAQQVREVTGFTDLAALNQKLDALAAGK
jgi:peroxiredoxin